MILLFKWDMSDPTPSLIFFTIVFSIYFFPMLFNYEQMHKGLKPHTGENYCPAFATIRFRSAR